MAIAFDAAAGGFLAGGVGGDYDLTSLTVGSGSDRALVAAITDHVGDPSNITSVTWDQGGTNQAMTKIGTTRFGASRAFSLWYLTNPISGNKTLRVAQTGGEWIFISAAAYTGVLQTGQPEANNDEDGAASPNSISVTVITANAWLVMGASGETGNTTSSGGSTLRAGDGFGGNVTVIVDSNGGVSAGSQSLSAASDGNVALNLIALAPSGGGGGATPARIIIQKA